MVSRCFGYPPEKHSNSCACFEKLEKPVKNKKVKLPEADNYQFNKIEKIDNFLLIRLSYPNCKNYEGNKILLFKNTSLEALLNQKRIDPHFIKDKYIISPIARFVPTEEGWNMAIQLINVLKQQDQTRPKAG